MEAQLTLIEEIRVTHAMDPQLGQIREEILVGKAPSFVIHEDDTIRFDNRVCVSTVGEFKTKILDEGHNTPFFAHPGEISCIRI